MNTRQREATISDLEFSTFYLGEALFGISLLDIQEINKQSDITRVPQASDDIKGILNLRGRIVTMIDLGKKLGLDSLQKTKENRNIIVDSGGEYIGLMVDAISNVVTAKKTDLEPAPANISGVRGTCFVGVLKTETDLIGILNIDEILKENEAQNSAAA